MPSHELRAARDRSKADGFRHAAEDVHGKAAREKVLDIAQQYEEIATEQESEPPAEAEASNPSPMPATQARCPDPL